MQENTHIHITHVVPKHFLFFRVIFRIRKMKYKYKQEQLDEVVRCHFCYISRRQMEMKYSTVCRMLCQTLHTECVVFICAYDVFRSEFLNSLNVQYPSIMYVLFNEVYQHHTHWYMFNQKHCSVNVAICQWQ